MKIVCISSYFLPYVSGAIMYPVRILTHLARRGHSVQVFTFRYDRRLPERDRINGINIRRLPYDLKIVKGFLSFSYPLRIARDISDSDVILFNQPVFEGLFVIALAKLFRKKIISLVNCEVDLGRGLLNRIVTTSLNAAVFAQLWCSDAIVGYTEDYASHNWMLRRFRSKLEFILPPIPQNPNSPAKAAEFARLKQGRKWVCFCGRISREKGLEYFIRSYQHLTRRDDVVYVFAGPYGTEVAGEERYYDEICAELAALRVPHLFLGAIANQELGALYRQIDCLVLPSLNRTESFGIVQVEAMRFGKPVIAADLPGVRVPVQLTGLGELCEPGNPRDLAQKIERVLRDPAFVTPAKQQRAAELFDERASYVAWDRLLPRVLAE